MSYCPRVQRWDQDDPNRPTVASFVWGHLLTPTGSLMAKRRNAAHLAKIDPLLRFPQDAHPPDAVNQAWPAHLAAATTGNFVRLTRLRRIGVSGVNVAAGRADT